MARIEQLEDRSLLSGAGLDDYERVSPDWFVSVVGSRAAEAAGLAAAADVALDRWIVRLSPETLQEVHGVQQVARILNRFDASFDVLRGLGLPGQVLVTSTLDPSRTEAALAANPCVASFELDTTVSAQDLTPSDPLYADQWGLAKIDAPAAWDVTRGSATVVVAVVDSGIDATHPDLYRNIWLNQGEIPSSLPVVDTDGDGLVTFVDLNNLAINGSFVRDRNSNGFIDAQDLLADPRWANGYDDDQNGFIDDLYGWDFVNYDPNPADDVGHGTHVAGTIGAMGNNRNGAGDWVGGAGVAWDTSLMSLKFLDANNQGSISAAIEATNYITMMRTRAEDPVNVRVSNNSWGQSGGDSLELKAAIEAAGEAGVLFVAAAGNGNILGQGVNNDLFPFYPASFGLDCVVSVAATGPSDDLASFSNYGAESVDIAAPGVGIWSTKLGGGYASMDGTSMATPSVSGVAALVWAKFPGATAIEVRNAILKTAATSPAINGLVAGGRLLDAWGAVCARTFAPQAELRDAPDISEAGGTRQVIEVCYDDVVGVKVPSIDAGDIVVTHLNGAEETLKVELQAVEPFNWAFANRSNLLVGNFVADKYDDIFGKVLQPDASEWSYVWYGILPRAGWLQKGPQFAWPKVTFDDGLVGDFNRDGLDDIVCRVADGEWANWWWLTSFDGSGMSQKAWAQWENIDWAHVTAGDFNGDGYDELVGQAAGGVNIGSWCVTSFDGSEFHTESWGNWDQAGLESVAVSDFNHDERDDLLLFVPQTGDWWLAQSTGTSFTFVPWGHWYNTNWIDLCLGDFDGDGREDAAARFTDGAAYYWQVALSADSGFQPAQTLWPWGLADWAAPMVGDFNGDSRDEIVGRILAEGLPYDSWWINWYDGTSYRVSPWGGAGDDGQAWLTAQVGDFDADGYDDIAGLRSRDGGWSLCHSVGSSCSVEPWIAVKASATATYWVTPPGGTWDATDNGEYQIALQPGQVTNATGLAVADQILGTFQVKISDSSVYYVNSSADSPDACPGDGVPADANGCCTLRAAVEEANAAAAQRTIVLEKGLYALRLAGAGEEQSATGDLDITGDVIILGAGRSTTIDGRGLDRVFDVRPRGRLELHYLTVTGGNGGLRNSGTTVLENVTFSGNQSDNSGGGLTNYGGYLIARACTIAENTTTGHGGAVYSDSGTVRLENTTICGNRSSHPFYGGGVSCLAGTLDLLNCTITRNYAWYYGALCQAGTGAAITVKNCIIAGNTNHDLYGSFTSLGHNIVGDANSSFDAEGDRVVAYAGEYLGPLEDNGGPTDTCALLTGSPAFDAGDNNGAPSFDQRGLLRLRTTQSPVDIGAFEAVSGRVDGRVFYDRDGDQICDEDEPGIAGCTVFLDSNANGLPDTGELATTTQADEPSTVGTYEEGCYSFRDSVPGAYSVVIQPPPNWTPTIAGKGGIERVSVTSHGEEGHGDGLSTSLSGDGRYVAFASRADDLVPYDNNGKADVFVHDRTTGTLQRVSVIADGLAANGDSTSPSISADGRYVAFESTASNLVTGDDNAKSDVFLWDRLSPSTLVCISRLRGGDFGNNDSKTASTSGDGRYVAFASTATNFDSVHDSTSSSDIYCYDRIAGTLTLTSTDGSRMAAGGERPVISAEGDWLAYVGYLSGGHDFDVFLCKRTEPWARDCISDQPYGGYLGRYNYEAAISGDGRYVVFASADGPIYGPFEEGIRGEILFFDRDSGTLLCVTHSSGGGVLNGNCKYPAISADGRYVAFESTASNLVAADTNDLADVFVWDRKGTTPQLANESVDAIQANEDSLPPDVLGYFRHLSLSADGRCVAFRSYATNLVSDDYNATCDIFVNSTAAAISSSCPVQVVAGTVLTGIDFGNRPLYGGIRGRVFHDWNRNGNQDYGEAVAEGQTWTVYLDLNGNSRIDGGEPFQVIGTDDPQTSDVDETFQYAFTDVTPLTTYTVILKPEAGWEQSLPGEDRNGVWTAYVGASGVVSQRDFGVYAVGAVGQSGAAIIGRCFVDQNGNGSFDEGEAVSGTLFIDSNNNGLRDDNERPTLTNPANGTYSISNLGARTYAVRLLPLADLVQASPAVGNVFTPKSYALATGCDPQAMATADLDGRNGPDLVVASSGTNWVSILLNQGAGNFVSTGGFNLDAGASAVAIGDFDGRNGPDVAVAMYNLDKVAMYLNRGDGSFDKQTLIAIDNPQGLAAGDLNGDDKADLVVTNPVDNQVSILWGVGDGSFDNHLSTSLPVAKAPSMVVIADFDGVNGPDMAVSDYLSNAVSVFLNLPGEQGFQNPFADSMRVAVGEGPWCVATAELNAGHRAYLVVTNIKSNTVSILENDGSGHFAKVGDYAAGSGPLWVASTDLDGDGLADLAVAVAGKDSNSQLAILWNQGGATFSPPDYAGSLTVHGGEALATAVVAGDWEGEGRTGLAIAMAKGSRAAGAVTVLSNVPSPCRRISISAGTETVTGQDFVLRRQNHAPVLTVGTGFSFVQINEDQAQNTGMLISALLASVPGDPITDSDYMAVEGVAVIGAASSGGHWEYFTDAGTGWLALPGVSEDQALLLRPEDGMRFVPDGENGETATIRFRAWDQTSGAAAARVSVAANGSATAFSTAAATASVIVTSVNDAPFLDTSASPVLPPISTADTNNAGVAVATLIASVLPLDLITDVDHGALEAIALVAIETSAGRWQYSLGGVSAWADLGVVSEEHPLPLRPEDWLRYVPGTVSETARFSFRAWDQGGGSSALSAALESASVSVGTPESTELRGAAFSVGSVHAPGAETTLSFTVANLGGDAAGAFEVRVVLSDNDVIGDSDDIVVATRSCSALAGHASVSDSFALSLSAAARQALYAWAKRDDPPGLTASHVSTSSDYLGLVIDPANAVPEADEGNNSNRGQGLDKASFAYFPWDNNSSGQITPTDAIFVINRLGQTVPDGDRRADPDGSGSVTPTDAIGVINRLGYQWNASVTESSSTFGDTAGTGKDDLAAEGSPVADPATQGSNLDSPSTTDTQSQFPPLPTSPRATVSGLSRHLAGFGRPAEEFSGYDRDPNHSWFVEDRMTLASALPVLGTPPVSAPAAQSMDSADMNTNRVVNDSPEEFDSGLRPSSSDELEWAREALFAAGHWEA